MAFIFGQFEKMYKDVLFKRHDPDGTIFYFSSDDFEGLNRRALSFLSKKGQMLKGAFYFYANPRTDRLIVFDHGLGTGHRAYLREIEMLCRHGYTVFSYDHTGCGESQGESVMGLSGSLSDLDDCLSALKKLPQLAGVEISVVGHSWGGYSTLNILGYHSDIHSVVAMSGFLSVKAMQRQIVPFVIFPMRKQLFDLEKRTNPRYAASSALDVIMTTDKPILVIHSLDDPTVSAKNNILKLRKETCEKDNIEFILQNGKGHSVSYTTEAAAYKREFHKHRKRLKKQGLLETDEQKKEFLSAFDWYEMTDQDEELWEKIFKFLG
ncbi:MAG: alpha/beta fold hydrolase [Clostridia bacterium]|nr:alpha/beta fold hydrolase [Clostridia bacterium]